MCDSESSTPQSVMNAMINGERMPWKPAGAKILVISDSSGYEIDRLLWLNAGKLNKSCETGDFAFDVGGKLRLRGRRRLYAELK